tara:strand:+ start:308 stop:964 length:657 start_codon:yes stop_codon:yes gene_type:complete
MNETFKYRLYGRSKGRKKLKKISNYNIEDYFLNIKNDFKKKDKIIIDVGSGNGENSIKLSTENKKSLIIACDKFNDGNINLCNYIKNNNLNNIKLYNNNILKLLDSLNKKNFVREFWILFPDPWPKNRHHKRRLINVLFLKYIYSYLDKNGKIFIATDCVKYIFSIIKCIYEVRQLFKWNSDTPQTWKYEILDLPHTKFFKKAKKSNKKTFFVELKKI